MIIYLLCNSPLTAETVPGFHYLCTGVWLDIWVFTLDALQSLGGIDRMQLIHEQYEKAISEHLAFSILTIGSSDLLHEIKEKREGLR